MGDIDSCGKESVLKLVGLISMGMSAGIDSDKQHLMKQNYALVQVGSVVYLMIMDGAWLYELLLCTKKIEVERESEREERA